MEEQLQAHERSKNNTPLPNPSTSSTAPIASPPGNRDLVSGNCGTRKLWEGIYTSTAQSHLKQYYGPSSSFYFIGRMSSYLAVALQQPQLDRHIQPNSASMYFASPMTPENGILDDTDTSTNGKPSPISLTGIQEDYFLSLFWQSYHCVLQIIDEVEFREHYKSLWATQGTSRKPS